MLQIEFNESGPTTTMAFSTFVDGARRDIGSTHLPRHAAEVLLRELLVLGAIVVRSTEPSAKPILDGDARVKTKRQF